ncbi:MAG TPA: glycosyl hydrolase family 28-related protein, partial [Lacipirellulaceae bacterium]|nr:glycosyl hydrolase family 28-related protein [Lacipirellulaceae bacterium]
MTVGYWMTAATPSSPSPPLSSNVQARSHKSPWFLALLTVLMLCVRLVAAEKAPERFDVRAFGAVGDGIADDQPALTRAARALTQNKGGVLYFPSGRYRCGRGRPNGIEFTGVSNVTVLFGP